MARLRGCLPLLWFLVFFISCVEGMHHQSCHRVFPLQLTAAAMPCRYICAYYNSHTPHYRFRWEDDGTPCHKHGLSGVCWNGECLTRYGQENEWTQQADSTSKVPLRIRKRDVSSTTKGASLSKTVESNGDSSITTTKNVKVVKTIKSTTGSEETKLASTSGLKGTYMTGFSTTTQASKDTKIGMPSAPTPDIDPFAIKHVRSGGQTTQTFFSRGSVSPHIPQTVKNGGVRITVRRGPNGEQVTTRTVRKYFVTQGPTKTVRKIIIRQGPIVGSANLIHGGSNKFTTKTVKLSVRRGPSGGTNGLMMGGKTGVSRKTSQITTVHTTDSAPRNPISSIVHTIQQQRISGGQNVGGASTATKTISTVAVTKSATPSLSVVQVTKQGATPMTADSLGTSNTATLRGVEVEVPGYTAGLRHNWKWVLARRVGVYPPYIQALDPEVLFYKLGLRKPNLPSLPVPVLNVLNRVPVHPVGSDLYGYLLSSKILEKIRGFTDGVNGLTRLRSLLSTTNTSNEDNSHILKRLLTGTESSPLGSNLLTKLILASLSRTAGSLLKSPYASLLGGSYTGTFGSQWPTFSTGPFSPGPWPFYNRGPLGGLGTNPSLFSGSPRSLFGSDDSLDSTKTSTGVHYTPGENGGLLPSPATPSSEEAESLIGDSSSLKSILYPTGSGSHRTERRYGSSYLDSLETGSENLAQALGEEKLRQLLKIPSKRDSPVRHILNMLYRRDHDNFPRVLRRLGVRPHTRLYRKIMQHLVLARKHGDIFSTSKYPTSYREEPERTRDLISTLRELSRQSNYGTSTPSGSEPRLLEPFESSRDYSEGSNNKLTQLVQLLLERKRHPLPASSPDALDSSDTKEEVDAILNYGRRKPSSHRVAELGKQITKALLISRHGSTSTEGTTGGHISKLVSVHGTSSTEKRPQGLTESQIVSTSYQTSKGVPTAPILISPGTASALEVTRQITQATQPGALLGMNNIYTSASSQPSLQPYPQYVPQPFYLTGGNTGADQATMLNRQILSSTGSVYGGVVGQPTTSMVNGAGGYSGYATMPTNAAYLSQYAMQPYYFGTSLYGNHPHYVVEGHEAPGTRWQLRVWRHSPGVSSVASGVNGFASSHLGSVVTRAREAVTHGLQLGSQPGRFGFTTFAPSVTGASTFGATSQYVVRTPDGSIALSRQPLTYGSTSQGAPASSVVVSQIKETTKTTSGTGLPTMSGGLSSRSLQSSVDGATLEGTRKSESLSDLTQGKVNNLLNGMNSYSDSENKRSSFSSDGATTSSLQNDADLSQSKLRR